MSKSPQELAPGQVAVQVVRRWLNLEDWQNVPTFCEELIEEIEEAIRDDRKART